MVTQELIAYVRGELNKGKTRDEIRSALLSGGGWSEQDVSEVFRTIIPMESLSPKTVSFQTPLESKDIRPMFSLNRNPIGAPKPVPTVIDPKKIEPTAPVVPPTPVTPIAHVAPVAPVTPATPVEPKMTPRHFEPIHAERKMPKYVYPAVAALLFGAIIFAVFYFFRPELASFNQKAMNGLNSIATSVGKMFEGEPEPVAPPYQTPMNEPVTPVEPVVKQKVNCGSTVSPDRKNPTVYNKDQVLKCIGENAAACNPAEAVLDDEFFPTVVKITESNNSCRFELSYSSTSTLTDVHGKKLAGRMISCPLNIVKAIDETNPQRPVFVAPNTTKPNKYATDIYFYGTLGIFIEKNFDLAKINAIGCNGEFINSVIESYKLSQ